jgi:hypothetical protein
MRLKSNSLAHSTNSRAHPGRQRDDLDQAAIFQRLEVTKKYGLVSDYLVSWSGLAGRQSAKVIVWGKDGTPEDVVRHYIARLLHGLVTVPQITVASE